MSEPLSQRIGDEMKQAMREKDAASLAVLRALKSAVKYAAIEKHGADGELDDAETVSVIRKQIKQRQDSVESFRGAGRDELADKEEAEIRVLEQFLPRALAPDEVVSMVEAVISEVGATSKKEMGQVMKLLQERAAGRADGKTLSSEVAKRLS